MYLSSPLKGKIHLERATGKWFLQPTKYTACLLKVQTVNDVRDEQLVILRKKKYGSFHGELLDVTAEMCLKDPEPQNQLHI
jgi:hypothetical protein